MKEVIYNLFLIHSGQTISEIAVTTHKIAGSEEEKTKFLQERVHKDLVKAQKFKIPPITQPEYEAKCRLGKHLEIFESIFDHLGASQAPLMCITPVVDGSPRIDVQTDLKALNFEEFQFGQNLSGKLPDYLSSYIGEEGFDIVRLINDDFMVAIKLLWNSQKYVSTAKLLVSMLDSVAFVEFGDKKNSNIFCDWLAKYADLSSLSIETRELWEFRNSILHMSNLSSRAVLKGKYPSLVMYVGIATDLVPQNTKSHKYIDLHQLIQVTNAALVGWLTTYSEQPVKIEKFVERYDLVVSDSRMASFVKAEEVDNGKF